MEQLVLQMLNYDVALPTSYLFVRRFAREADCDKRTTFLAQYLSELALMDGETYLVHRPSLIAACCVALARHTCGYNSWPAEMVMETGYTLEGDLKECLVSLYKTFQDSHKMAQQTIREKYRQARLVYLA